MSCLPSRARHGGPGVFLGPAEPKATSSRITDKRAPGRLSLPTLCRDAVGRPSQKCTCAYSGRFSVWIMSCQADGIACGQTRDLLVDGGEAGGHVEPRRMTGHQPELLKDPEETLDWGTLRRCKGNLGLAGQASPRTWEHSVWNQTPESLWLQAPHSSR